MNLSPCFAALLFAASVAAAQQPATPEPPTIALTIFNQNFAVARTTLNLDLQAGINNVETNQVTNQLEPDSGDIAQPGPNARFGQALLPHP